MIHTSYILLYCVVARTFSRLMKVSNTPESVHMICTASLVYIRRLYSAQQTAVGIKTSKYLMFELQQQYSYDYPEKVLAWRPNKYMRRQHTHNSGVFSHRKHALLYEMLCVWKRKYCCIIWDDIVWYIWNVHSEYYIYTPYFVMCKCEMRQRYSVTTL